MKRYLLRCSLSLSAASEAGKEGIGVKATSTLQVKKVEELTFYLIWRNNRMEHLERELKNMKSGRVKTAHTR